MFRVGQKVVCVDAASTGKYMPPRHRAVRGSMHGLRKGGVYTIRDLDVHLGVPVCRLVEITRPIEDLLGEEAAFAQARFRPIVARKTDISIFTAMLNPSLEDLRAIVRENANVAGAA